MGTTVGADEFRDLEDRITALQGLEETWAACTDELADAPLPCRTGYETEHCRDGLRVCGADNGKAPMLELEIEQGEYLKNTFLETIEFHLPTTSHGALLFNYINGTAPTDPPGYTIQLKNSTGQPLVSKLSGLPVQPFPFACEPR